jgi:uncharacterized protein YaaW (UPF0174 family)
MLSKIVFKVLKFNNKRLSLRYNRQILKFLIRQLLIDKILLGSWTNITLGL